MARYYVTHSCGHVSEVHLLGKMKNRQWRLDQMALELCPDCEKKENEEWQKKKSAKVVEWLEEIGISEQAALFGSEKQVKWAGDLRRWFLYDCFCFYDESYASEGYPREYVEKEKAMVFEYLAKKELATFWIDHRKLNGHQLIAKVKEILQEELAQVLEDVKKEQGT